MKRDPKFKMRLWAWVYRAKMESCGVATAFQRGWHVRVREDVQ